MSLEHELKRAGRHTRVNRGINRLNRPLRAKVKAALSDRLAPKLLAAWRGNLFAAMFDAALKASAKVEMMEAPGVRRLRRCISQHA